MMKWVMLVSTIASNPLEKNLIPNPAAVISPLKGQLNFMFQINNTTTLYNFSITDQHVYKNLIILYLLFRKYTKKDV